MEPSLQPRIGYKRKPGPRAVALTAISNVNCAAATFHRLKHGKYVIDKVVIRFCCLFNAHKRENLAGNPKYTSVI